MSIFSHYYFKLIILEFKNLYNINVINEFFLNKFLKI